MCRTMDARLRGHDGETSPAGAARPRSSRSHRLGSLLVAGLVPLRAAHAAEASISKMVSTELSQRMVKYATRLLGEYALLERRSPFAPDGDWLRRILASESMTIAGGTSAVQRNMIGERILGLPKG